MDEIKQFPSPDILLPHRYPLLLIDRIIDYQHGTLRAIKCVSFNEPYFQGHFPNLPIVPGVLLVEMMAQASAALYRLDRGVIGTDVPLPPGRIAAIEKARFMKEVAPGDLLIIESRLRQRVGGLARFEAQIMVSSSIRVAEAILILISSEDELPSDF